MLRRCGRPVWIRLLVLVLLWGSGERLEKTSEKVAGSVPWRSELTSQAFETLTEAGDPQRAQVLLDVASIAPDRILLLDSYFYVVVFHGTSIAQWRKEGYHLQPEHAGFKELLEARLASSPKLLAFPVSLQVLMEKSAALTCP